MRLSDPEVTEASMLALITPVELLYNIGAVADKSVFFIRPVIAEATPLPEIASVPVALYVSTTVGMKVLSGNAPTSLACVGTEILIVLAPVWLAVNVPIAVLLRLITMLPSPIVVESGNAPISEACVGTEISTAALTVWLTFIVAISVPFLLMVTSPVPITVESGRAPTSEAVVGTEILMVDRKRQRKIFYGSRGHLIHLMSFQSKSIILFFSAIPQKQLRTQI